MCEVTAAVFSLCLRSPPSHHNASPVLLAGEGGVSSHGSEQRVGSPTGKQSGHLKTFCVKSSYLPSVDQRVSEEDHFMSKNTLLHVGVKGS